MTGAPRVRATPAGLGLGLAGLALTSAGAVLGLPLPFLVGAAALSAVTGALVAAVAAPALHVEFVNLRQTVHRGQTAHLPVRVRNDGRRRSSGMTLDVNVPGSAEPLPLPAVGAGRVADVRLTRTVWRRGELVIGPVIATFTSPLALTKKSTRSPGSVTLTVAPASHAMLPPVVHNAASDAVRRRLLRAAGTEEFRRLRPYVHGDDRRRLDWRASARTGGLLVREHADPVDDETCIVVDDTSPVPAAEFEEIVDVAASMYDACRLARLPASVQAVSARWRGLTAEKLLVHVTQRRAAGGFTASSLASGLPVRGACLVVCTAVVRTEGLAVLAALRSRFTRVVLFDLAPGRDAVVGGRVEVVCAATAREAVARWNERSTT